MGFNKKVLSQIKSDLNSAKAPARKKDIIVDPAGQWKYPGQATRIPSNQITMQGVNYPVFAQPNIGQPQMMYPGQDYNFPGADYVDEYPQMKKGGQKKFSRSLEATNKLFTANPYVKKKKSKKKKIFNPNAKYYQSGGESRSEELLGVIPVNSGRKTLRDWTYGESIGMLQENDGGYVELDLTPEEIEEYKRGGYVVEDISIPSLNRFDKGGEKKKKKKKQTEAQPKEFEFTADTQLYKLGDDAGRAYAKSGDGTWYEYKTYDAGYDQEGRRATQGYFTPIDKSYDVEKNLIPNIKPMSNEEAIGIKAGVSQMPEVKVKADKWSLGDKIRKIQEGYYEKRLTPEEIELAKYNTLELGNFNNLNDAYQYLYDSKQQKIAELEPEIAYRERYLADPTFDDGSEIDESFIQFKLGNLSGSGYKSLDQLAKENGYTDTKSFTKSLENLKKKDPIKYYDYLKSLTPTYHTPREKVDAMASIKRNDPNMQNQSIQSSDWLWTAGVLGAAGAFSGAPAAIGEWGELLNAGFATPIGGIGVSAGDLAMGYGMGNVANEWIAQPLITGETPDYSLFNIASDAATMLSPFSNYANVASTAGTITHGIDQGLVKTVPRSVDDAILMTNTIRGLTSIPIKKQYGGYPRYDNGGSKETRKLKRAQRKAARNFEYDPEAEFSLSTQPGEEKLPAYMYPGKTVAINPIPIKSIEIADREIPEIDTVAIAEQAAERAKQSREEKRQSLKNTDNIKYKKLSRPAGEIILENEMNDEMSQALKDAGYYINQLESGDYEVIANKDIANLIYKKGITANELSNKFKLGDAETLQKYFQPVYNNAQSIHAKRNAGKINDLIEQGYTKDQAIKALAKQGEGTVSGLTNLYGTYAEATYQKNKAEADALTALAGETDILKKFGVTNIDDLTDYQKKKLLEVAAFDADAKAKLSESQANAAFLNTYMPEVGESTAYRGLTGVDTSGQSMYGTTAYDKAQNEISAVKAMTDEFKYREGAQAELAKKILTSSNLTDEQRKNLIENPDKFSEIYQSYVNWMQASSGSIPKYIEREYTDEDGTKMISVEKGNKENASEYLKSDFEISPEGASWTEAKEEPIPEKPIVSAHFEFPEVFGVPIAPAGIVGSGSAAVNLAGKVGQGISNAFRYAPIKSVPSFTANNVLRAKTAYDVGNVYIPEMVESVYKGNMDDFLYNTYKTASGLLPYTKYGNIEPIKNIGDFMGANEAAGEILNTSDPSADSYLKLIKSTGSLLSRQYGGEQDYEDAELTPEEIEEYRRGGYIVEEY
jgi:hypothetical protein